jgi:1-acyl-sn-glycerol-3-phosphate acyltransferase
MDAFFAGVATRRHVRYMAKTEIFRDPRRLARFARNFTFCSRCCSASWRR